jgi:hypothetical protein
MTQIMIKRVPPIVIIYSRFLNGVRAVYQKRGVYFLANDNILDLAVAFLNSFRSYNPSISLCMIPFNEDIQEIMQLQSQYDFSILQDPAVLRLCDDISLSFHDGIVGHYRKLAAWEGCFDEFIYIDSDTIILENIDFVFDHLKEFSFLTSHSDIPQIRKFVWKESIDGTGKLTPRQLSFAASTGFVASKRACLGLSDVLRRLPAAIELSDHMELSCCEQPFLNYLIVTSGMPYTSLHTIAQITEAWDMPQERWAGDSSGVVVRDGQIVRPKCPPTLLVHWAGEWKRAREENRLIPLYGLWSFYRHLRVNLHRDS